jgi:hypothetical protein
VNGSHTAEPIFLQIEPTVAAAEMRSREVCADLLAWPFALSRAFVYVIAHVAIICQCVAITTGTVIASYFIDAGVLTPSVLSLTLIHINVTQAISPASTACTQPRRYAVSIDTLSRTLEGQSRICRGYDLDEIVNLWLRS